MIFPGMDPYLEEATLWSGVHTSAIVYIRNQLQPLIRPRYLAAIEERVYVEEACVQRIPDVWVKRRRRPRNGSVAVLEADEPVTVKATRNEVHEANVAIRDRHTHDKLVTLIELVSPTNKIAGTGRDSYLEKQVEISASGAHLVEIDLLRAGRHVLAVPLELAKECGPYLYLMCVNRAEGWREKYELYLRDLRHRLPRIRIPLAKGDPDVTLDLQAIVEQAYVDGCYDDRIDYSKPCKPRLSAADQTWANQLIKKAVGRNGKPARV